MAKLKFDDISTSHADAVKKINELSISADWTKVNAYVQSWDLAQQLNKAYKFAITDIYGDLFPTLSYNSAKFIFWVYSNPVHAVLFQKLAKNSGISTNDIITKLYWLGYMKFDGSVTEEVYLENYGKIVPFQLSLENFKVYIGIGDKSPGDTIAKVIGSLESINDRIGKFSLKDIASNVSEISEHTEKLLESINKAIQYQENAVKKEFDQKVEKLVKSGLTKKQAEIALSVDL